ncbi:hypothetical protein BSL78_14729 [Apostichopus japonicus]|uniref:Ig-like domain-containing protein n=1 Tax=Stichopus japonicus TaxID=307972 RepID=A0A2G8KKA9_STIJA|nr:hypothetical protein BSL78_14729 [Apostichopus japonicus]
MSLTQSYSTTGTATSQTDSRLVCPEIYLLNVNEQGEVSCDFDSDFISVRWYESGGTPLLRYDGTEIKGPGKDSGEFDMKRDGSMIIRHAKPKHDGTYSVTVLHSDATSSQATVKIIIIVPLESVSVQDCQSEPYDLCKEAGIEERSNTLVCIARGARPPVDLTWQAFGDSYQPQELSNLNEFENTIISTVPYDTKSFTLQNVTCIPNGYAVKNVTGASLLVTGERLPSESTLNETNIQQGSQLQIKCPPDSLPLAQLYITLPGHNKHVLMETNVTTLNGHCLDDTCHVEEDNLVSFEDISYKQDGIYKCISSDVLPANASVYFKGCASTESCTRNGTKTGSLTCSVSGLRPPVELTMTDDDDSKQEVKLTNHRRETTTDPESGTSESYLTVEYEIVGCDGTASLTCSARPDKFARKIKPSKITLTTDKVKCMDDPVTEKKGKGGLIAGLLVVFAVIAAIVVFIVIRTRKKGISKSGGKQSEETESRLLPVGQAKTKTDENDVEVGGASTNEKKEKQALLSTSENQETDMADTESKDKNEDTKQKNADETAVEVEKASFTERDKVAENEALLSKNKVKTPDKKKKEKNKTTKPKSDKAQKKLQVQKERFKEELDKFIAKHGVCVLKSSTETVEILRIIAEKKQVSEKCLEIAKQQYLQKKHKIDELLKSMAVTSISQKEPSSDAVDALVQYAILKPLDVTEEHRNISYIAATNAASKIKYIKIVQAIQERFGEGNFMTELKAFLKTVAEKVLIREDAIFKEKISKILEDSKPTKAEEITSVFVRMLLFSFEKKLIEIEECMEMLQSGLDKHKLTKSVFTDIPRYSQTEGCLCKEFMFQILREAVVREKITEIDYFRILEAALNEKQIQISEYMGQLTKSVKDNLIKKEEMMDELRRCAMENLGNEVYYCYQMNYLLKNKQLTYKEYTDELESSVDNNWVKRSHVVEGLQDSLKNKLINEQQLLNQLCQIHVGGEISAHIEALQLSRTKNLISEETLMSQFQELVKKGKLDVTGYINEMRSCLQQGLINQTLFLKELRKVSESGKLNIEGLTSEMKNTLEKKLISQEEFCENLSYLFKQGKISEDMFLNQLTNLFVNKKLREESFLRHISSLFIGDKLAKNELMEEYLTCLAAELIETGDYLDTLKIALERNLIDDKFIISTLRDCLRDKSVNEDVFLTRLNDLFKTGKITRDEFVNEVKNCLKEKSISETTFFAQLDKLHDEKKYTIAEFTGELENCVKEKLISEEQFCKKLNNLLEKRLLQLENLLDQLQNCFKNKLIQEDAFLGELTSLFTSKQMSREKLMDFFHKLVKASLITKEGFFDQLKYLLSNNKLSKDDLIEEYRNCVKTNLISMDMFCKKMDGLVSDHLINSGDYLDTLETCLESTLIQKESLVSTLRDFLQQKFMDEPAFLKRLQNLCSKSVITTQEYIEELWNCLKQSVIPQTTFVAQIDSLLETKKIDIHGYFTELENCLHHKSISPAFFCEKLNQLLTSSKVDIQGFIAEIQNCFLKDLIDQSTFFGQLKTKFVDQKISREVLMEVYHACLQKQKISVNDYWNELFDMLKNGKISINDFVQELSNDEENEILGLQDSIGKLHGCRKENLMTEEALCTFLEDLLQKAKLDITEYNTELKKCVDANLISNEIYSKQIEQQEEKKKIDFREAFKALCTEITSDKGTNDKFQEVLKKFHKKYKESPSNYMEEYIDKEDIAEKLPPETSLSLLAEIFSLHQLLKRPTLNYITQITVEEFVAGTKFLLDEKKITAKGILATLKEVSKSKMNVDEVFRQIGFLGVGKEKIHHPYFLQAIQGIIGDVTVQQKNTLRSLFEKILTKAAMKTDECIAILTASKQKGQVCNLAIL